MKKRVLILGGGFGGLYAALQLEKTIARDSNVEVTLVNRDNFILFTPMLHEIAAGDLDVTDIVVPLRKLLHHINVLVGEVESVDMENRRVKIWHGGEEHSHEIPFDYLLVSMGSVTNFFHLPGLQERAFTMKTISDAIHLRNRLIANLEEASFECAAGVRNRLLTFVVAGGGFAGVETAAGLNDFVRDAIRHYPQLQPSDLRVVLVHPGDVVLPELGPRLGAFAQRKLMEQGIEILSKARVAGASDEGVDLMDGTRIATHTIVWTAGVSPNPVLGKLACRLEKGRICVNEFLEAQGAPDVWAIGDCAVVPNSKTGQPHPPTAQHAVREGKIAGKNIAAAIRGTAKRSFRFTTLGQLASIGRRTGVANILGFHFSGFLAWWMWRTIYLSKLPGLDKKIRVALSWTLDLLFSKDTVQLSTHRAAHGSNRIPHEHDMNRHISSQDPQHPDAIPLPARSNSQRDERFATSSAT